MKRLIFLSIILIVMMIITPLISVKYVRIDESKPPVSEDIDNSVIKVMSGENGFIKSMNVREYLIGCVSGEMSVSYHEEALKAQAVASYTYAKYISSRDSQKLGGADISDDSSVYQSYIDKKARQEKWGDQFAHNEKIIESAVDQVLYEYISYKSKPIMAVYHNLCSGKTESAENVWGSKVPYLISVTSSGDKLSPVFESESIFKIDDFKNKLNVDKAEVGEIKSFDSGIVDEIDVNGKVFSGQEIRNIFGLKSSYFKIKTDKDSVVFTCFGNGHFVGMSQYGADYMARQGSTYKEILQHYYPGTDILTLKK